MTTPAKIGIGLAALVAVGAVIAIHGNNLLNKFSARLKGYGVPRLNLSTMVLTLPIKIQFSNPTPAPINLDRVSGTVSIFKNGQFQPVVTFNQALSIAPGTNESTITSQIDIKKLFSGNLATASLEILRTGKLRIRTDLSIIYGGIAVPVEPLDNNINVV